jgi:simple sugar transport system ATP-binding protein
MLGEEPLVAAPSQPPPADGPVLVRGQDLVLPPIGRSGPGVRNASFTVRGGEVVGIAAVEGNGQRELLRAIAGLVRPAGGALEVRGQVGFIPEDRTTESLIGDFSLTENIVLSQGRDSSWVRGPWLSWARARQRTIGLLRGFDVRAASPDVPARALSGGNQQRLVIAAVLERRPAVLVAENPTRGLDLKATGEVLSRLAGAARAGLAVIVHSSDLDELLLVSDRIVTLADGRVTELPRGTGRDAIGSLMLAGKERFLP